MAKKDLVVNIDSTTKGLEQGMTKSVNEVRKLEQQTRKSKNEFKQFDDRVGKLTSGNLSGLLGTLGSVAGILGVAKLAQEGFNKTMRASQETSDAFDVIINQASTSVDYFFTALSTGNFENFFQGITSAIAYSRELTTILDGLSDMKFADKFFLAEENYELEKNRAIINAPDGEYSQEQKKQALEDSKAIIADMEKRSKIIAEDSKRARVAKFQEATATLNSEQETAGYDLSFLYQKRKMKEYSDLENHYREEFGMRPGDFDFPEEAQKELDALLDNLGTSQDEIINYLFDTVYSGVNLNYKKFEQYQRQLDENKPVVDSKTSSSGSAMGGASRTVTSKDSNLKYEEAKKELKLLGDDVREEYIKFYEIKNVIGDKDIEEMVKLREQEFDRKSTIERTRNTLHRLEKRVLDGSGGGDKENPQEGSIGYIDEQIKDLNKEFKLAINEEDRKRIKTQLEELEAKKAELELKVEITIPEGSLSAINEKISKLNAELSLEVNEESRIEIWKEIKELEEKKLEIEVGYKQEVVPTPIEGVRDTMFDYNKTTADKLNESLQLKNSYISELKKETELFADELNRAEEEASTLQNQLNFQYVKDDLKSFNKALTDSYMDAYSQTMNIASAFTNLANSVQSLSEDDDTVNQWEKLLNLFSAVGNAIQSLVSTIELYNKIEDIITSITAAKQVEMVLDGTKAASEIADITALTTAKVTATSTETAAAVASNTAITASLVPLISAATTLMAAESTAAYAMIPFAGVGLAASQIASMEGLIAMASIPKFAEGGIVYGNTIAQVGEYAGASTNPEVIAPLSKLRDILADTQQGGGIGGVVDFRIAGKDLVGVFNNYTSKQSKI